ncbi:hypothetical protein H0H93_015853, partial [Arthromyces matolae]
PRIQRSLDETIAAWNSHKMRTEGNRTPTAIYELSRERAINGGYWTGDPGDNVNDIGEDYGEEDATGRMPPADEVAEEPTQANYTEQEGVQVNDDEEIEYVKSLLDFDYLQDDGNAGIDVYCHAVMLVTRHILQQSNQ